MRKFRFRAYYKPEKKMIEPLDPECYSNFFTDDDYIVMQYTGLKDKNNIRIYEGDIVKNSDNWGLTKGIIEWDDEYFGYPLLSEEVATGNKLIVIGNIYEGEG